MEFMVNAIEWSGADGRKELIPLSFLPAFGTKEYKESKDKRGHRVCTDGGVRVDCRADGAEQSQSEQAEKKPEPEAGAKPETNEPKESEAEPIETPEQAEKIVAELAPEIEKNDVAGHEFTPEEAKKEKEWAKEYVNFAVQNIGKALMAKDLPFAARFMTGLFNAALGGAAFVTDLLGSWVGMEEHVKKASDVIRSIKNHLSEAFPGDEKRTKLIATLTGAVMGKTGVAIAKQIAEKAKKSKKEEAKPVPPTIEKENSEPEKTTESKPERDNPAEQDKPKTPEETELRVNAMLDEVFGKSLTKDLLPGGKGDDRPDEDFDPQQLTEGILHELEHTDDPLVAREIAKDHLSENPLYYSDLAEVEGQEKTMPRKVKDAHGNEVELGQVMRTRVINGGVVEKVVAEIAFPRHDHDNPVIVYGWDLKRNGRTLGRYGSEQEALNAATTKSLPDEDDKGIGETLQSVGSWLASKWAKLESRYGRRMALAIALAQLSPVPFVGTTVIGVAEAIRGLRGYGDVKPADAKTLKRLKSMPVPHRIKSLGKISGMDEWVDREKEIMDALPKMTPQQLRDWARLNGFPASNDSRPAIIRMVRGFIDRLAVTRGQLNF